MKIFKYLLKYKLTKQNRKSHIIDIIKYLKIETSHKKIGFVNKYYKNNKQINNNYSFFYSKTKN